MQQAREAALRAAHEQREEVNKRRLADWGNVMRSKGFCWMSTHTQVIFGWSHAGALLELSQAGYWFAAIEEVCIA